MTFTLGTSCFLPPSAGIAVGFYGNGESSDGASRVAYSLRHANRTISGVEKLVGILMYFFFYFFSPNPIKMSLMWIFYCKLSMHMSRYQTVPLP